MVPMVRLPLLQTPSKPALPSRLHRQTLSAVVSHVSYRTLPTARWNWAAVVDRAMRRVAWHARAAHSNIGAAVVARARHGSRAILPLSRRGVN